MSDRSQQSKVFGGKSISIPLYPCLDLVLEDKGKGGKYEGVVIRFLFGVNISRKYSHQCNAWNSIQSKIHFRASRGRKNYNKNAILPLLENLKFNYDCWRVDSELQRTYRDREKDHKLLLFLLKKAVWDLFQDSHQCEGMSDRARLIAANLFLFWSVRTMRTMRSKKIAGNLRR